MLFARYLASALRGRKKKPLGWLEMLKLWLDRPTYATLYCHLAQPAHTVLMKGTYTSVRSGLRSLANK
jgi:hypothetical protein